MPRAIFYLTYNGIFNNTNGIGTQTKTFLAGIERHYAALAQEFGPFAVHLVAPAPDPDWWGFCTADLTYAEGVAEGHGGAVHYCPYQVADNEFWSPEGWLAVATGAAALVLDQARRYERTLVIANDIPFLHTPGILAATATATAPAVDGLIALYGSSHIHTPDAIDPRRLAWEAQGLAAAARWPAVKVGDVGRFMRRHLGEQYGVPAEAFVPYRSSLELTHPDFALLERAAVLAELRRHGLPEDRPLLLAFGRADRIKGFDVVLEALRALQGRAHLVLNVVPYAPDDPILDEYRALIARYKLDVTLLCEYSRTLPAALCQWPGTLAVVCASRGEPLSNIPFEVSLWARAGGPVLVCADRDGYQEQIEHGVNGLLFAPEQPRALAAQLAAALEMEEAQRTRMRRRAYEKVVQERDFTTNFRELLASFWR